MATPRSSIAPGQQVGNYIIERQLGSGGEANVFLARDIVLRRQVAVKVLHDMGERAPNVRGLEEARLIATLDHPNIVRIYHVQLVGGVWYVAMEYVDGGNVDRLLRRKGPLKPSEALLFAASASDALQHAHDIGVIHRDVKPKNLLVTKNGILKLADFGLASAHVRREKTKAWVGTPQFMAPEVWEGDPALAAADIYSLGGCLYFMLTGRPPFEASTVEGLRKAHLTKELALPPQLPPVVVEIVRKSLAKKASLRHPSAQVFFNEVQDALIALGVDRRRSNRPPKTVSLRPKAQQTIPGFSEEDRNRADDVALNAPPLSLAMEHLKGMLPGPAPVVLLHGPYPRLLNSMAKKALEANAGRVYSMERLTINGDDTLAKQLSDRFDLDDGPPATTYDLIIERLADQKVPNAAVAVIQVEWERDLNAEGISELQELARRSYRKALLWLVTCDSKPAERLFSEMSSSGHAWLVGTVSVAPFSSDELFRYVDVWTAAATAHRLRWTPDALLLLAHFAPEGRGTLDALVHNAIVISLGAGMRLITTWAVLGASAHARELQDLSEILPRWGAPPPNWPDEEMMSMLRRLRSDKPA